MRTTALTTLTLVVLLLMIATAWWASSAQGREDGFYKLYDVRDSRGPVTRIGYAYYPDARQLRVRAIIGGRLEAWGIYRDPQTIEHMLQLVRDKNDGLFAVFDQDQLLALYRE